jgi:hypothetical protein
LFADPILSNSRTIRTPDLKSVDNSSRHHLFARYRALRDADYARRIDDPGFEAVATAIADATAR